MGCLSIYLKIHQIIIIQIPGEPSVRKLLEEIDKYIPTPSRDLTAPFLMAIDNSFTIPGRGSVVVGTVKQGIVKKNAEASLMGFGQSLNTSLSDIQVFKKSVPMVFFFFLLHILNIGCEMKISDNY